MIPLPDLTEIGAVAVQDDDTHEVWLNGFMRGWAEAHGLHVGRRQPVFAWLDDNDPPGRVLRLAAATDVMEKYG